MLLFYFLPIKYHFASCHIDTSYQISHDGRSRVWRGGKILKKHRHLRLCPKFHFNCSLLETPVVFSMKRSSSIVYCRDAQRMREKQAAKAALKEAEAAGGADKK